jgi:hypothetical protein
MRVLYAEAVDTAVRKPRMHMQAVSTAEPNQYAQRLEPPAAKSCSIPSTIRSRAELCDGLLAASKECFIEASYAKLLVHNTYVHTLAGSNRMSKQPRMQFGVLQMYYNPL